MITQCSLFFQSVTIWRSINTLILHQAFYHIKKIHIKLCYLPVERALVFGPQQRHQPHCLNKRKCSVDSLRIWQEKGCISLILFIWCIWKKHNYQTFNGEETSNQKLKETLIIFIMWIKGYSFNVFFVKIAKFEPLLAY